MRTEIAATPASGSGSGHDDVANIGVDVGPRSMLERCSKLYLLMQVRPPPAAFTYYYRMLTPLR